MSIVKDPALAEAGRKKDSMGPGLYARAVSD